jgi:hypothetical protein
MGETSDFSSWIRDHEGKSVYLSNKQSHCRTIKLYVRITIPVSVELIQTGTLDPMKLQLSVDIMQSGMDLPSLLKTNGTSSSRIGGV